MLAAAPELVRHALLVGPLVPEEERHLAEGGVGPIIDLRNPLGWLGTRLARDALNYLNIALVFVLFKVF